MKPPWVYTRGILHFVGRIRRSTYLAYSAEAAASAAKAGRHSGYGRSVMCIYPRPDGRGLLRRRIILNFECLKMGHHGPMLPFRWVQLY